MRATAEYPAEPLVAYPTGPRLRDSNITGDLPVYDGPAPKVIRP